MIDQQLHEFSRFFDIGRMAGIGDHFFPVFAPLRQATLQNQAGLGNHRLGRVHINTGRARDKSQLAERSEVE
ncbi:MAG: hypothetical protein EXR62_10930 [Chloroflexi bacterium]|nr:hypothetical protein [Chloroflexota bacterium]